jgi:hypothetical protein
VAEAYEILSNPSKRASYDRFGMAAFRPGAEPTGFAGREGPAGFRGFGGFDDFTFDHAQKIFEQFFGEYACTLLAGLTRTRVGSDSMTTETWISSLEDVEALAGMPVGINRKPVAVEEEIHLEWVASAVSVDLVVVAYLVIRSLAAWICQWAVEAVAVAVSSLASHHHRLVVVVVVAYPRACHKALR